MTRFSVPIVMATTAKIEAVGGNVGTIGNNVAVIGGNVDELTVSLASHLATVAENRALKVTISELQGQVRSGAAKYGDDAHQIRNELNAFEEETKKAKEEVAKIAISNKWLERAYDFILGHFISQGKTHTAHVEELQKEATIKEVANAVLRRDLQAEREVSDALRRELADKDEICTGLYREVTTNNALEDLTNALKRRHP